MGPTLIPLEEWLKKTGALGRKRSPQLKALDSALGRYETSRTRDATALADVKSRLNAWKATQGGPDAWKKSVRNRDGLVELLTTLVEKGEDSDSAWGRTPDFMHEHMVNSRLGVVYLFSHMGVNPKLFNLFLEGGLSITSGFVSYAGTKVVDGGLGNVDASLTAKIMPNVMTVGTDVIDNAWSSSQTHVVQPALRGKLESLAQAIRNWFADFAKRVLETLRQKWNCELPGAMVKSVTNSVCSAVLSVTSAGIVSGAVDTTKGVIASVDAIMTKVNAWKSSRDVEFASGHPSTVVDSINRGMIMSIGEGLWQLLKGIGNIGIAFGTAGAGLIMGVVIAGAEFLVKLFYRLYEVLHMQRFFGEAGEHWRNRLSPDALHRRPFAFASWYRKYALNTPPLAVLTLNSGICGDKMIYLSMFRNEDAPITTAEFTAGAKHLESLKVWGADYLKTVGFSFRGTTEMTGKLVQFAKGEAAIGDAHAANLTGGAKVWDWVKRFATA